MMNKLKVFLRHLWLDASDARRAIPPDMLQRLAQRVAASERRHSGEIRLCVEASLPASYLWRLNAQTPMRTLTRQRAVTMFGKLRVWDTEHNNGVLIYLLLAEHAIEIVADRRLGQRLPRQTLRGWTHAGAGGNLGAPDGAFCAGWRNGRATRQPERVARQPAPDLIAAHAHQIGANGHFH